MSADETIEWLCRIAICDEIARACNRGGWKTKVFPSYELPTLTIKRDIISLAERRVLNWSERQRKMEELP